MFVLFKLTKSQSSISLGVHLETLPQQIIQIHRLGSFFTPVYHTTMAPCKNAKLPDGISTPFAAPFTGGLRFLPHLQKAASMSSRNLQEGSPSQAVQRTPLLFSMPYNLSSGLQIQSGIVSHIATF